MMMSTGCPNTLPIPSAWTSWYVGSEKDDEMNPYGDAKRRMSKTSRPPSSFDSNSVTSDKMDIDGASNIELESQRPTQKRADLQASAIKTPGLWSRIANIDLKPSSQTTEDAVMGTSDGMTVPFALTASLAGIVQNARYVMLAGLAELTAGALSMALGGLLQAKCERESYQAIVQDTRAQVEDLTNPDYVPTIIDDLFTKWDFSSEALAIMKRDILSTSAEKQTEFIARFHHQLKEPDNKRPFKSAGTLGACYFFAGLIGLFPYICVPANDVYQGLYISIGIEAIALFVFGYLKTGVNVGWRTRGKIWKAYKGAFQMLLVGAVAAGVAVGLIMAVNKGEHISG